MPFAVHKRKDKIAVVGTGSGWELLPIQSDHTIYCLNDFVNFEKFQVKPDVLFIMDILDEKPQILAGVQNLGETIMKINKLGCPLIAPYKYAEIPKSEAFPIHEVVKEFGIPYFSNTICYMIAYAILKGAKEIDIFGVNQAGSHEYAEEKGAVEYWIGVAVGRGVKVTINGKNSGLLRYKGRHGNDQLYGYLQNYQQIVDFEKRFGTPIVKQLSAPPQPVSRVVRNVNHDSQ
jgi:hypothetical protein